MKHNNNSDGDNHHHHQPHIHAAIVSDHAAIIVEDSTIIPTSATAAVTVQLNADGDKEALQAAATAPVVNPYVTQVRSTLKSYMQTLSYCFSFFVLGILLSIAGK